MANVISWYLIRSDRIEIKERIKESLTHKIGPLIRTDFLHFFDRQDLKVYVHFQVVFSEI